VSKNWTPHDYQLRAVESMVSLPGFGLFAEPGLGKTSTTLAAFSVLKDTGHARGLLVVTPLRPAYQVWPQEIQKWTDFNGLKSVILHGPKKDERLKEKADVYIINYEGLQWLEAQLGKMKTWPFDVLCLDESTKIKNTQTVRYKVAKQLRAKFSRVWALTGTPAPNGIENLFGQIFMLDGGERLGRYVTHFRREYFTESRQPGGYSLWFPRRDTQERVQQKVADITLSLSAEEYLKMPRVLENTIRVTIPGPARAVYKSMEEEFFAELNSGVVTAANAAVIGMKLRQMTGGAVYGTHGVGELHDAKLEALADLIEEQEGQPIIVAVAFTHEVDRIRAYLKDKNIPYLGGGVKPGAVNTIVADWNAGKIPVLLAHPTTVALGLNLQSGGCAVCWYSLTWNLEEFDQTNRRVWRQGQTKPVTFHYIIADDTIDSDVLDALRSKDRSQKTLMKALRRET
jgi:SNF2 family DNA or RNA helicase